MVNANLEKGWRLGNPIIEHLATASLFIGA